MTTPGYSSVQQESSSNLLYQADEYKVRFQQVEDIELHQCEEFHLHDKFHQNYEFHQYDELYQNDEFNQYD